MLSLHLFNDDHCENVALDGAIISYHVGTWSSATSIMATPTNGNGNLIDEFEEAFQQCLSILITKDEGLGNNGIGVSGGLTVDKEEARSEVEQVTLRFIDLARQMEAFFLQKRFLLSALKPELVVKEDINDLRVELARKEDLIKRHYDKITVWQNLLADLQGWAKSPAQGPAPNGSGAPPTSGLQGVGVSVGQQGMFMTQGGVGVTGTRGGFPVAGVGSSALQGPLAFLEKTTSNIGMPERRS
ncbi:hypothetical protein E2986_07971 [Frieseomelitta varia]|uniref:Mediator of RNA polymerase II transcription subunit 28 n=1 Tax=Frieseomelitta varia TaxID=561572 RepID=A0A833VRI0_9HYME|nr:hypothetical protein E2986_07971 [Frieseomelitta varia]